ncbi:hypothetical protein BDFB_013222 [Asbolus verrucosus]|uniref:Uncharacterized protein n=1 Tax=Asbolus verrucosus TaxID=1661398 RepID=A0A482VYC6_ASBVE|nr:hypothetical protein BDFB_013222 [Asbolus verrucosus]
MQGKNFVGAATRYIAGRNAVQTVYWRGVNSNNSGDQQRFMKVLRTVQFAKSQNSSSQPPARVREEHNIRF